MSLAVSQLWFTILPISFMFEVNYPVLLSTFFFEILPDFQSRRRRRHFTV